MALTENMSREERQEYWELVISEFSESGLTKTDYCKNNEIPVSTFNYWENRLKELGETNDGSRFVELKVHDGVSPRIQLAESFPTFQPELGIDFAGLRILINSQTPMSLLSNVLGEMGYA